MNATLGLGLSYIANEHIHAKLIRETLGHDSCRTSFRLAYKLRFQLFAYVKLQLPVTFLV